MRFHITPTDGMEILNPPSVAALMTQISWHKSPIGFDDDGDPVFDEMTPEDIEKMEFFRAYRVTMTKRTKSEFEQTSLLDSIVRKSMVSPWFDSRDPEADQRAKRDVLGFAIECCFPDANTPEHTEDVCSPHTD